MTDSEDESDVITCPCQKKPASNLWIECSHCEVKWHPACCGLDGVTQAPINKLMNKQWKCPRCFTFPESIPAVKQNEPKTKLSEDTVSDIIAIVNSTVEENLKTLLSPENLRTEANEGDRDDGFTLVNRGRRGPRNIQNANIQNAIQEQREEEILIDKKKDNLIIYGMPESATENKKDEMLEDFRRIKKIYDGKVEIVQTDIKNMTRLGIKDKDKTRPIQITLAQQSKRKELLTKNMNLKDLDEETNTSTNIYVSPDRTLNQRAAYRALRAELTERKKTNPNLVIRNNKIVVPFRPAAQDDTTWASISD